MQQQFREKGPGRRLVEVGKSKKIVAYDVQLVGQRQGGQPRQRRRRQASKLTREGRAGNAAYDMEGDVFARREGRRRGGEPVHRRVTKAGAEPAQLAIQRFSDGAHGPQR